jgi:hypothetical protein
MHPSITNIGLMVTKNEAPILKDIMDANIRHVDRVYVLDGGSDEAERILRGYPQVVYYLHERELERRLGRKPTIVDGIRGYLLDEIRVREKGFPWITLMHGDEIFYHDPRIAIQLAEKTGANIIAWYAPHFFPHADDYRRWDDLKNKPLIERFRHFAYYGDRCWLEHRQYRLLPDLCYLKEENPSFLPVGSTPFRELEVHPIYHHFKVWNLDMKSYTRRFLTLKRFRPVIHPKDKWSTIPYMPITFKGFFIKKYHGYPAVGYFDGTFGTLEAPYNEFVRRHLGDVNPRTNQLSSRA